MDAFGLGHALGAEGAQARGKVTPRSQEHTTQEKQQMLAAVDTTPAR